MQDEHAELYLTGRDSAKLAEVQQDAKALGVAAVHIIEVPPSPFKPFKCQCRDGPVSWQPLISSHQADDNCIVHDA